MDGAQATVRPPQGGGCVTMVLVCGI